MPQNGFISSDSFVATPAAQHSQQHASGTTSFHEAPYPRKMPPPRPARPAVEASVEPKSRAGRNIRHPPETIGLETTRLVDAAPIMATGATTTGTGELPSGREQRHTPLGRVFFVDHNTCKSIWEDPRKQKKIEVPKNSEIKLSGNELNLLKAFGSGPITAPAKPKHIAPILDYYTNGDKKIVYNPKTGKYNLCELTSTLTEDSSKVPTNFEMKMSETERNLLKAFGSGPATTPAKPKRMADTLPRGLSARKTAHGVYNRELEAGQQALKPTSKPLEYEIPTSAGILRYHGFPPRAPISKSARQQNFPRTESTMAYNGKLNRSIRGYLFGNPVYNLLTSRTKERYLYRLPFNVPGRRMTSTQNITPGPFGGGPVVSAPQSEYSTTSSVYTPSSSSYSEHEGIDLRDFPTNRRPITGSTPNSAAFRHIRPPPNSVDSQSTIVRAATSPFISFPSFCNGAPRSGPKSPYLNGQFPNRSSRNTYVDNLCKGFSGMDQVQTGPPAFQQQHKSTIAVDGANDNSSELQDQIIHPANQCELDELRLERLLTDFGFSEASKNVKPVPNTDLNNAERKRRDNYRDKYLRSCERESETDLRDSLASPATGSSLRKEIVDWRAGEGCLSFAEPVPHNVVSDVARNQGEPFESQLDYLYAVRAALQGNMDQLSAIEESRSDRTQTRTQSTAPTPIQVSKLRK